MRWGVHTGGPFLQPDRELGPYPERITDALDHWAASAPERTFLAERSADGGGDWDRVSYAEFRRRALAAAQWLLRQNTVSAERPIAILSGNSVPHAVLAMGAMYAGIPYAPVSPAYALHARDFTRLHQVIDQLTPGLIFAFGNEQAFRRALPDHEIVTQLPAVDSPGTPLPRVRGDDIAKILFTSGSTGVPKGVITTHRMLTSNQEMLRTLFPFLSDEGLVLCDWLPWNHTFGGSHNFGIALYNGGSLYLDRGKPVAGPLFEETVRNLREVPPTVCFNVPKGFEMLVDRIRADSDLRLRFFSRLRMMFYAAAGLSQHIWDALDEMAIETTGARIPMITGLGATETAPMAICATPPLNAGAGRIGLPVPGVRLKLWPVNGKLEVRVQGPNVTPGFWRNPELTAAAFDEDGYYKMGDAARFVDPEDPNQGLIFDGRISEDFKLTTGTWVSVGPLRTALILHCAPYLRDAVIAGHDRDDVTALLFPDLDHYGKLEQPKAAFEELLGAFAREQSTGSSNRIVRALVELTPPSLDGGEMTDKGSLNSANVLRQRAASVSRLYAEVPDEGVLIAKL